jgi:16S rRNA C967 or C1407 C5-methylase (RsmB/RsmF family)
LHVDVVDEEEDDELVVVVVVSGSSRQPHHPGVLHVCVLVQDVVAVLVARVVDVDVGSVPLLSKNCQG